LSVVFLLAGKYAYTLTERRSVAGQSVEQIRQLSRREYEVSCKKLCVVVAMATSVDRFI